jgi:hypothetical protein
MYNTMQEDKQTTTIDSKERINEQRKRYYNAKKERDPSFLEYKRTKAKEYYAKKKAERELQVYEAQPPVPEPVPAPVSRPKVYGRGRGKKVTKSEPTPESVQETSQEPDIVQETSQEPDIVQEQPVPDHIQEPIIEPKPVLVEKKVRHRKGRKATTEITTDI